MRNLDPCEFICLIHIACTLYTSQKVEIEIHILVEYVQLKCIFREHAYFNLYFGKIGLLSSLWASLRHLVGHGKSRTKWDIGLMQAALTLF